jgi:broad specificity phosphatase PhoE
MNTRLILISHAATPAMRQGAFPADEPLDLKGLAETAALRERLEFSADTQALSSPAARALDTAHALGLAAQTSPGLADTAYGDWRGRRLADIAAQTPAELAAWTQDPQAPPRGGESFNQVLLRIGNWLESMDETGNIVAVTHASVIRAALIHVLNAPSSSFTQIEVPPLSTLELRRSTRGWVWWAARA